MAKLAAVIRISRVTETLQDMLNTAAERVMNTVRQGSPVTFKREPSQQEIHLDDLGHELVSGIPVAPPIGYIQQPPLAERIREMVRSSKLAEEVAAVGAETFDEADDFDVGDDYELSSPFEEIFEGDYDPGAARMRLDAIEKEEKEKVQKAAQEARDKLEKEIREQIAKEGATPLRQDK